MRATSWIIVLAVAVLSVGCATGELSRKLSLQPLPKSLTMKRQEPGHNLIIDRKVVEDGVTGIDVVVGNLPRVMSTRWMEELADGARRYSFWLPKVGYRGDDRLDCNDDETSNRRERCREEERVLQRTVFRAVLYRGETAVGHYDAVINKRAYQSATLMPFGEGQRLGANLNQLLISSDGRFGVTTNGMLVSLDDVEDLRQLPPGTFERYPSPVVIQSKSAETDEGHGFIGQVRKLFPDPLNLKGKRYLGQEDAWVVWRKFTSLSEWPDKVMTCVSYNMGPGVMTWNGIMAAGQTVVALSSPDCLRGTPSDVQPREEVAP